MKSLVIFDSNYGNTREVVEAVIDFFKSTACPLFEGEIRKARIWGKSIRQKNDKNELTFLH